MLSASCRDEDVLLSKPGEPIQPVSNLGSSFFGPDVILTWELPQDYPDDVVQPVSVMVRVTIDGHNEGDVILENAPTSYTHPGYDPAKAYKFTVKVRGEVETDDPAESDLRYSLGQTVNL